ncbi:MAG: DUF4238 domain-containing protein [Geodermatophilaceae bacterium]
MGDKDDPSEVPPRREREAKAWALAQAFEALPIDTPEADEQARQWLAAVKPQSHVGSLHHTVPRFILQRWARDGQVLVYSRVDRQVSVRNVKDLGMKDFYSFIDIDGRLDSTYESLLGEVEAPAAAAISRLLSPFGLAAAVTPEELFRLAQMVAFQVVRTTRRRRELELQAEWYAKTMARGRVADAALREVSVVPHQNELVQLSFSVAEKLMPFVAFRPAALVVLDKPQLLLGDEPVLVNAGPDDGGHHPDCFLTDDQIRRRIAKEQRKKLRLRRQVGRVVHFRPTATHGLGVALELLLPVSPRAAIWWGPLSDVPFEGPVEVERLSAQESQRFAALANEATREQALDWIISTVADSTFTTRTFPDPGPLMTVCDGNNAAASALNEIPTRFRPHRLERP